MKKRLISMMLAVATAVSFTACSGVEANTSRTSSVESSSIAESTESTTSTTTDSKADATTTVNSESEVSSTTTTNSSNEDTTTESTSSTSPKEEKIEERDVYDEDGNVVDKIKVKIVDGVAYTVENKNNVQHIIGEVPLYTNDPEFPYGEAITLAQIMAAFKGCNVSQKEIFEKYVKFYNPSDWYEEDGINKGPNLDPRYLLVDPRTKRKDSTFTNTGNEKYYTMKVLDEKNISYFEYKAAGIDVSNKSQVKEYIDRGEIAFVTVEKSSDYNDVWSWLAVNMGDNNIMEIYNYMVDVIILGYKSDKYIIYNAVDARLYYFDEIKSLTGL